MNLPDYYRVGIDDYRIGSLSFRLFGPMIGPEECEPTVYVISHTQAARELGIDRKALAEFVRRLRIEPKPMAGRGKGLSASDVRLIRRALDRVDRLAISA